MSDVKDGKHSHYQPKHFLYDLGPYDAKVFVIYHYKDRGTFDLFFTSSLPDGYRDNDEVAVFKIPKANKAIFEMDEVWTGEQGTPGQYKTTFTLLPAPTPSDQEKARTSLPVESLPGGICSTPIGDCAGTYSDCQPGEVIKKVDGVCGCYSPEGG